HVFGNHLLPNAEILATESCAADMANKSPAQIDEWLRNSPEGVVGEYIRRVWGPPFVFKGFELAQPTSTFSGKTTLHVGNTEVQLIDLGPAHTPSDTIVFIPERKIVYAADVVFLGNTPVLWAGPIASWMAALDFLDSLDVNIIVPGHGPVTDTQGLKPIREYLAMVEDHSRRCFDAGISV